MLYYYYLKKLYKKLYFLLSSFYKIKIKYCIIFKSYINNINNIIYNYILYLFKNYILIIIIIFLIF